MLRITVVCVGRIKEKYLRDAIDEYAKRLSGYCRLEIAEVQDEKTVEGASDAERDLILEKEGRRVIGKIPEHAHVVALAIEGSMFGSTQMAEKIETLAASGKSHLVFVIGGSLGLSREVTALADERWSFSKLTFPHQIARLLLLEQLYRSYRISRGEPYHK